MSREVPAPGTIVWTDLTVPDAESVRDFYRSVIGWRPQAVDMKGYEDFVMTAPESGDGVAGVCHARGENKDLPAQWLIYVAVEDLEASIVQCHRLGGAVLAGPRPLGEARYCVIRDPAGAVCALIQSTR